MVISHLDCERNSQKIEKYITGAKRKDGSDISETKSHDSNVDNPYFLFDSCRKEFCLGFRNPNKLRRHF